MLPLRAAAGQERPEAGPDAHTRGVPTCRLSPLPRKGTDMTRKILLFGLIGTFVSLAVIARAHLAD